MIFTTQPCFSNKKIDRPNPLERQTKKTNMETIYQVKIFALRLLTQNYFFYSYNDTNHKLSIKNHAKRILSLCVCFLRKRQTPHRGNYLDAAFAGPRGYSIRGEDYGLLHGGLWPLCRRCKFFRRNNLGSEPCRQLRQPRFTQRSKSSLPLRLSSCSLSQD